MTTNNNTTTTYDHNAIVEMVKELKAEAAELKSTILLLEKDLEASNNRMFAILSRERNKG